MEPQILLVLCGVVGSGKSTLAQATVRELPGDWSRVNQDDLGSRPACESLVRRRLSEGKSVVVDRQNFDPAQRRTWLEIGNEFPLVSVRCMVMGTTAQECEARLRRRTNHPTIDSVPLALQLLDKFIGLWVQPALNEGFDNLLLLPSLPPSGDLTLPFLLSLLADLEATPTNPSARAQRSAKPKRGGGARGPSTYAPPKVAPPVMPGSSTGDVGSTSSWRGGAASAWSWATAGSGNSLS